jgi:transposase
MNEAMRLEIVQRRQSGMSMRAIADELGISRGAVARALARVQAQRDGRAAPSPRPRPRQSIIDPFEPILKELLAKYPNLTTERALQELQARLHRQVHGRAPAHRAAPSAPRAGARAAL